jgi:hypothetical protein
MTVYIVQTIGVGNPFKNALLVYIGCRRDLSRRSCGWGGCVNSLEHGMSNAVVESVNTKIRSMISKPTHGTSEELFDQSMRPVASWQDPSIL